MRRRGITIGRLMAGVAVVAVLLAQPWNGLWGVAGVCSVVAAGSAIGTWGVCRGRPRRAAWCFGVSAVACSALVAWGGLEEPGIGALLVMTAAAVPTLPVVVFAGAAWAASEEFIGSRGGRRRARAWCLVGLMAALPVSMVLFQWPFRLVFLATRPAWERLADRVEAGHPPTFPVRIGCHTVHWCIKAEDGVILFRNPPGKDPDRFVRERGERRHASPFLEYDFLNNRVDLFGQWSVVGHD